MVKPETGNYKRSFLWGIFLGMSMLVLAVFLPVLAHFFGGEWGHLSYLAFGDLCHQQIDRSLQFAGVPLAVCARCLGIYIGIWVGIVWAFLTRQNHTELTKHLPKLLLFFVVLNILQWGIEYTLGYLSANSIRFVVGMLPGGALSVYIIQSTINDHIKLLDYGTEPAK